MHRSVVTTVILLMCWSVPVFSDSGVVLESSGDIHAKLPSGEIQPLGKGKKCPDGTFVITGASGRAVVITEFGQMFRIGPNTQVVIGEQTGSTSAVSLSQGMILALRESLGGPEGGPRAHGAVKGLGGNALDAKMTKRSLEKELKEADALPVESAEAKAIIKAQVYYRYGEYRKVIALLDPIYRDDRKAAFVRELLAKSYEKLGER